MYLTIQQILNLSQTLNLNHNVIIPMQHVIMSHEPYKHHTILTFGTKHVYIKSNNIFN